MTFIHPVFPWNPQVLFPVRHPRMLRKNSRQFTNDFGGIPRGFSRRVNGARNQRVVFVSPRILDSRLTTRKLHLLSGNSREKNATRHSLSQLKAHPTCKKNREGGILVEFSFSLQRHADLPHDLALVPSSCQLSPNQFTAIAKLA